MISTSFARIPNLTANVNVGKTLSAYLSDTVDIPASNGYLEISEIEIEDSGDELSYAAKNRDVCRRASTQSNILAEFRKAYKEFRYLKSQGIRSSKPLIGANGVYRRQQTKKVNNLKTTQPKEVFCYHLEDSDSDMDEDEEEDEESDEESEQEFAEIEETELECEIGNEVVVIGEDDLDLTIELPKGYEDTILEITACSDWEIEAEGCDIIDEREAPELVSDITSIDLSDKSEPEIIYESDIVSVGDDLLTAIKPVTSILV
jgi:hypothetical protein